MSLRLDESIVLVTGACGGIGGAVCRSLKDAGATVVGTDLAERPAPAGVDLYFQHDVTQEADWARIAAEIDRRYGRLDALVNNAGIAAVASIEETSLEAFRRVQTVNVESIHIGTRAMLELLKRSGKMRPGGASIVNFSSIGGLGGAPLMSAYCTSKGAVKLYTKCCALEFGTLKYNIRANSVHPGGIHTGMMDGIMQRYVDLGAAASVAESQAAIDSRHALGRMGLPEEIAGGIVYLCSPAASFVTGSELVIDGGFSAS